MCPSHDADELDIGRSIVAIARAMDDRDWSVVTGIARADVIWNLGEGVVARSAAEAVALMSEFLGRCGATQHLIGDVVVDVSGDVATSRAYIADLHVGVGEHAGEVFRTFGDYHDEWMRTEDGWRLSRRDKSHVAMIGDPAVVGAAGAVR